MDLPNRSVPTSLIMLFCSVSLLVPLLVSLLPVRKGVVTTVKEALNNYGISTTPSSKNRLLQNGAASKLLSRPVLLSIRNAVSRKGRFYLNLVTLTFGGALFIAVVTSMFSMEYTATKLLDRMGYDYEVNIKTTVDPVKLQQTIHGIPEVTYYELWGSSSGNLLGKNNSIGNRYRLLAPSEQTRVFEPDIIDGRWLHDTDTDAIVVGHSFLKNEPTNKLGDRIDMIIGGEVRSLQIIGIVKEIGAPNFFISKKGFDLLVPSANQIDHIKISAKVSDGESADQIYMRIEEKLEQSGFGIASSESMDDFYQIIQDHYSMTITTFLVVACIVVVVGAIGLTSTMSIQVAERTREIGIMKAMGATRKQIKHIVTAESIFIGILSWLITLALGLPIEYLGSYIIGNITIKTPLSVNFVSFLMPNLIWFAILIVVGYSASFVASRRAARLSVKEALVLE